MMNFLKKLDRAAATAIDQLDKDVQMPIVRAISGEVFRHGENSQLPQKRKDFTIEQAISNEGLESKASDLPQAEKRR